MELLLPPQTLLSLSCKLPPRHPSTSISCKVNKCNSACKMVARGMAPQLLTIRSIRPNLLYLPNDLGLGRIAWELLLGNTLECFPARGHIHHSRYHSQDSKGRSTATNSFRRPQHIKTFRNRAAPQAYRRWSKTSTLIHKPGLSACRQRHHPPFRLPPTILARKGHPPSQSMEVVSTHPRTGPNHTCKACRMVVVPTKRLVPQMCPAPMVHPLHSMAKTFRPSNNNNKGCMTCELDSCTKQTTSVPKEFRWAC